MQIIDAQSPDAIEVAVRVLNEGGIVIYPTETAYGTGVDATNQIAVDKLLSYKKRPAGKAISIGVSDIEMAKKFVDINLEAKKIFENFLPGPVTVISKSLKKTDQRLESEKETLGIRVPNYRLILSIIKTLNRPITTTSANTSGAKTPYSVNDILSKLTESQKELVDLIIDGGVLPYNPPSTVIDTTTSELTVYRSGRIDPKSLALIAEYKSKSEGQTLEIGEEVCEKFILDSSNVPRAILLSGEMGSGKTYLTKGIAKKLGIKQVVKSPSYIYLNEYLLSAQIFTKLIHIDAWRIQNKDDLDILGITPLLNSSDSLVVIEWPSVIMNFREDFFNNTPYIFCEINLSSQNERIFRFYKPLHSASIE